MSPGRGFFITAWIKTLERIPAYTGILLLISFIVNESCGDRQITQEHGEKYASFISLSLSLLLVQLIKINP